MTLADVTILADYSSLEKRSFAEAFGIVMCQMWAS
jgi:hypothetical protein